MANYETLLVETKNRIALITINRPDKLNALNALAKSELKEAFESIKNDPNVDVVILTGDQIDAAEAYRIGLVNKVVPLSDLLRMAEEVARKIISKGQIAVRMALKATNMTQETNLTDGQALEASLFGVCCGTEDFQEGTKSFLEKRKPEFKNK